MLVNLFACKGDYGNSSIAYAFSNLVNKPVIATPYSVSFTGAFPRIGGIAIYKNFFPQVFGLNWYKYQNNSRNYHSTLYWRR